MTVIKLSFALCTLGCLVHELNDGYTTTDAYARAIEKKTVSAYT